MTHTITESQSLRVPLRCGEKRGLNSKCAANQLQDAILTTKSKFQKSSSKTLLNPCQELRPL